MEEGNIMAKVAIITGYGINADNELKEAFLRAGAEKADRIHINDMTERPEILDEYHILGFPGGFSFGDHLGSGMVMAHLFKKNLKKALDKFVADGKLVIGICNGFQVLVKMGVLPNFDGDWGQEVSLIHNNTGVFENSWLNVRFNPDSPCVWTKGLTGMDIPIRHGEGRFITKNEEVMAKIKSLNLNTVIYNDRNPNGSEENIAGITDTTGRILGLMPHPEAFLVPENHPRWKRGEAGETGLALLKNGVDFINKGLYK